MLCFIVMVIFFFLFLSSSLVFFLISQQLLMYVNFELEAASWKLLELEAASWKLLFSIRYFYYCFGYDNLQSYVGSITNQNQRNYIDVFQRNYFGTQFLLLIVVLMQYSSTLYIFYQLNYFQYIVGS
eukprot:TRINITY_DN105946_c0_g1_i6.p2 TRINITY_DN105946_c0_g1~~TRINITY_DN105946_c0_g1_i6.p2  ORF type:complete len:127 (-),score=3.58 TRINITY_DN105946_c0_g1_i6:68-448(-)